MNHLIEFHLIVFIYVDAEIVSLYEIGNYVYFFFHETSEENIDELTKVCGESSFMFLVGFISLYNDVIYSTGDGISCCTYLQGNIMYTCSSMCISSKVKIFLCFFFGGGGYMTFLQSYVLLNNVTHLNQTSY